MAANLLGDRNLAATMMFTLCNAGEPLLIAWLINRRYGSNFALTTLRGVLAFYATVGVGTAASAIGGTVGIILFHNSSASVLTTWLNWFTSGALGIVIVAPLVIGLARSLRDLPQMQEIAEGVTTLAVLSAASIIVFTSPTDYWFTLLPLGLLLPLLLWPAARCQPVFAAAGVFILALIIVWTTTFGIGRLGDPSTPITGRVHAARAALLVVSICGLVFAAVFAERRRNEVALKDSNDRLRLALGGAGLGVWSIDPKSDRFENDLQDRRIHGHDLEMPPRTLGEARAFIHPDDLPVVDAAFVASARAGGSYRVEYRLAPVTGLTPARHERWIALEGAVVRNANGRSVQLLGVTHDITERKQFEEKLQKSERTSRELLEALPAAIYVTDAAGRISYCNQSAVDLWGRKPKLGEDKWCDLSPFYHTDGTPMALKDCPTEIALKEGRVVRDREAIIERPDGTRIQIMPYPTPLRDDAGALVGVVNMMVDITGRKNAELALAERNVQLSLSGKAALVGSYAYDANSDIMQISPGYAAVHGLPDGTLESTRSEWKTRTHPEDAARVEELRIKALSERKDEYGVEYRIFRSGELRWIESRSFISYTADGHPQRVVGVNIDITERKRAEDHQRVLVAELDHRVKNVLATVRAVAGHTLDASSSMEHFVAALDGRIKSMASMHELLSRRRWRGLPLAELLRLELAPYATRNNTEIVGPEMVLSAEFGHAVAMVVHELVTNAAKYGALSTSLGRVSVQWYLNGNSRDGLVIEWQESGGPTVEAPRKSGYGSTVVSDLIPYELGGTVKLAFPPEGVRCRLEVPGKWVSSMRDSAS